MPYHIVILEDRLMLVKHDGDWRALQDIYPAFKTSLGPYTLEEAAEMITIEWPAIFAQRESAIRAFADSAQTELDL